MPVITENELETYTEGLNEVERLTESNHLQQVESERNLSEVSKKLSKSKKLTFFLGLIAMAGIGYLAYYMNSAEKGMISIKDHNKTVEALEDRTEELENLYGIDAAANTIDAQEVFAVQVGAFEKKDLSLYSENFVNFKEIKDERYNKYALGNFESLDEAKQFRKELVSLGLTDAFIGVYLNGERVRIEKVF